MAERWQTLGFRVSDNEKVAIQDAADKVGVPTSEMVRAAVLERAQNLVGRNIVMDDVGSKVGMVEEINRGLAEIRPVLNGHGPKELKAKLADLVAGIGRYNELVNRKVELDRAIADFGEAEIGEGSDEEIQEASRRLSDMRSQADVTGLSLKSTEKRLAESWAQLEKEVAAWRAGEAKKVIGKTFHKAFSAVTPLVGGLLKIADELKLVEAEIGSFAGMDDIARVRGLRILIEMAGGALRSKFGGESVIVLPKRDTSKNSIRLHIIRRRLLEGLDVNSPFEIELINGLAMLLYDHRAASEVLGVGDED